MIDPEEAWTRLSPRLRPLGPEIVAREAAAGRTLAGPLLATDDLPRSDVSALDGFAFGAPGATGDYRIAGTGLAGGAPARPLAAGEAARIMTGAPVPEGARHVLGFEECTEAGGTVRAGRAAEAGAAIRRRGEIFRAGATILGEGSRLSPAALALVASQGIAYLPVARLPRVEILVTGDEVRREAGPLPAGAIRDSHSDFLVGELERLGIAPHRGEVVADRAEVVRERLAAAAGRADVVLTTGGVSMGDVDLVAGVAAELGFETLFHGVAMQPGKPLLAAARGATLLFGLPGNPGSVMTSYWLFVRPALRRLAGEAGEFWAPRLAGRLAGRLGGGRSRDRFVPARAELGEGGWSVRSLAPKGSHDLAAFAGANALLRVARAAAPREAGADCEFLPLDPMP